MDLANLSFQELKAKAHEAVRRGDRQMVSTLLAECQRRLRERGVELTPMTPERRKAAEAKYVAVMAGKR